jgi:hypothetical protein
MISFLKCTAEMLNERYITLDALFDAREFYAKQGFHPYSAAEYERPNEFGLVAMWIDLLDEDAVDQYIKELHGIL